MKNKINKDIVFLCAQPDIDYYVWQMQVLLNNFKKLGVEKNAIILFGYNPDDGINPNTLALKKKTKAKILHLPDTRTNFEKKYIPSIQPNIIKELYKSHYSLIENKHIFFHDSDILIRELPDFNQLIKTQNVSLSDTVPYIGAKYIKEKGDELLVRMCSIVGIDPMIVINYQNTSGGAQHFIPSNVRLSYQFWNKVEIDSVNLYDLMTSTSDIYCPSFPIQSWTAGMWSLLWNLWLFGYVTQISDELSFSWATDPISNWDKHKIFHNAGVVSTNNQLFFKGNYFNTSPFGADFSLISKDFCSIKYVEEIIETAKLIK